MMLECCEHPHRHHGAIFEKYAEKRFKEASTIVQEALDGGFRLPHHAMPVQPDSRVLGDRGYASHFDEFNEEQYADLSHVDDGSHGRHAQAVLA